VFKVVQGLEIAKNLLKLPILGVLEIAKNLLKLPILGVQGRSRSSMLIPLKSSSAVLVMISSMSVSICNRSHA